MSFRDYTPEQVKAHEQRVLASREAYAKRAGNRGGKMSEQQKHIAAHVAKNENAVVSIETLTESIKIVKRHALKPTRLNKLESAWHAVLKSRAYAQVVPHGITLRIGDDCRYTPDFLVVDDAGDHPMITVYETKGFMRDDALVKIKTAAHQFPWITFVLVTRKAGVWHEKVIGNE